MSLGTRYETVVEGCGDKPVKYMIVKTIAQAVEATNEEKTAGRKAEVALTGLGTIIGRKVVYGADQSKVETHKKFDSIENAGPWFNKDLVEEATVLAQLKPYVEGEKKLPTFDV